MKIVLSPYNLIKILLSYCFCIKLIVDLFPVLSWITYLSDLLVIINVIIAFSKKRMHKYDFGFKFMLGLICFLFLFDLLSIIFYKQNFILLIWGMRNQYRFIIVFICASLLLNPIDIYKLFIFLDKFLYINIFIITIQFFIFNYSGDLLGGTFGIKRGCNSILNIFICTVFAYNFILWLNKKCSNKHILNIFLCTLYWSSLSELKMFYFEIIFMVGLAFILIKSSTNRKITMIIACLLGVIISAFILINIFPFYADFFKISVIIDYFENVGIGVQGFNRSTAISKITTIFFENDWKKMLFGLGTGSAEFSSLKIFTSEFYNLNRSFIYDGYFHAFMYIERGYLGLLWYFLFFLVPIIYSIQNLKKADNNKILLQITILCSSCYIITMIYDTGLRTAASGFLAFIINALPYVAMKIRME